MSNQSSSRVNDIGSVIRTIRGQRVILDFDLTLIYGVPTRRLNEQVKRNAKRFPADFLFQLTEKEAEGLMPNRSQIATASETSRAMRSQIATAYKRNVRFLPYA